jgi:hypothetical protein
MFIARRVIYRARVLTERWVDRNAFLVGLILGGTVTTLVLLLH